MGDRKKETPLERSSESLNRSFRKETEKRLSKTKKAPPGKDIRKEEKK